MQEVRALFLYKLRAHAPMCEIHGAVDGVHNPCGLLGNSFNLFSVGLFADEAMMGVLLSGKQFPIFQTSSDIGMTFPPPTHLIPSKMSASTSMSVSVTRSTPEESFFLELRFSRRAAALTTTSPKGRWGGEKN